jgi:hypothetical protein
MRAMGDNNTDKAGAGAPPPADPELAATLQALTGAVADPKQSDLVRQLALYDAKVAALEVYFNQWRDAKCFELWNSMNNLDRNVDLYEYNCWCSPPQCTSSIHCQAYSDVLSNATMHKMDAENRKQPGFGNANGGGASNSGSGGGGGGGGGRRLAEAFEAIQRMTAARSPRAAAPVSRRALMGGKGVLSRAAAVDGALSTAVAPYYGAASSLASPSSALVGSHGRRLQEFCGFSPKDGPVLDQFVEQVAIDTLAQFVQCVCGVFECLVVHARV